MHCGQHFTIQGLERGALRKEFEIFGDFTSFFKGGALKLLKLLVDNAIDQIQILGDAPRAVVLIVVGDGLIGFPRAIAVEPAHLLN